MRPLLLSLLLLLSAFTYSQDKVLICQSATAYAYHTHMCRGLNECTHSIAKVTLAQAQRTKRKACKYCYCTSQVPASNVSIIGGQCSAKTKKGSQCSRKASSNGYCWQHNN